MLLNPAQSPCASTGHLQGPEGSDLGLPGGSSHGGVAMGALP